MLARPIHTTRVAHGADAGSLAYLQVQDSIEADAPDENRGREQELRGKSERERHSPPTIKITPQAELGAASGWFACELLPPAWSPVAL